MTRAFKDLTASAPLSFSFTVARAVSLDIDRVGDPVGTRPRALWAILERRRIVATSAKLVDANRELADARLNLANEAERERRRIARDLHDQTLADLRHLALLTDQIKPNGDSSGKQTSTRSEIELISQEVRRICEISARRFCRTSASRRRSSLPSRTRCRTRRSRSGSNTSFTAMKRSRSAANCRRVCRCRSIASCRRRLTTSGGMRMQPRKMFVETSNAGDFALRIEDNGRPFDSTNNNSEGRGLPNMKARAGLIDASISWEPRETGGTVFTLIRNA